MGWGLQLAAQGCRQRGDQEGWRAIRLSLESGGFLRDGLALLQAHDPDGMVLGWLRHDPSSPAGWIRHEPVAELWQRPMLLIGGWHDPHLRGVLDLWQRARGAGAAHAAADRRLEPPRLAGRDRPVAAHLLQPASARRRV